MKPYLFLLSLLIAGFFAYGKLKEELAKTDQDNSSSSRTYSVSPWPPEVGKPYPDLNLYDHRGNLVKLSQFKGKVLLIEPIGMT